MPEIIMSVLFLLQKKHFEFCSANSPGHVDSLLSFLSFLPSLRQ